MPEYDGRAKCIFGMLSEQLALPSDVIDIEKLISDPAV